jgi:hypothetical protein
VLPPMPLLKAQDAFVIGHERTAELDRGRDQQPIRGIASFETIKLIAFRSASQRAIWVSSSNASVTGRSLGRSRHPALYRERALSDRHPRGVGRIPDAPEQRSRPGVLVQERRKANATASVLLPPVSFLAACSISAMTSGRLIVITFGMLNHLESFYLRRKPRSSRHPAGSAEVG